LEQLRKRKIDAKFGTWNVRSLYKAGELKTVARKLGECNLDPVAVQQVRWVEDGSQPADGYTFLYGNGNVIHQLRDSHFSYIRESHQ
jgi:hypothetical protein